MITLTEELIMLLHSMCDNMIFVKGVPDIFKPPRSRTANRAHAHVQRALTHWHAQQRAQAQHFYHAQAQPHDFLQHVHPQPRQHHRDQRLPRSRRAHAMRVPARQR